MKMQLNDQKARDVISQELRTNLLVEAGAGSGKTEEMAKRILALINSGHRYIGEIVAITFTRKAANELRERIRTTLEKEYAKTGYERYKTALDNIHECFIGTIHSFCAKMLRERPIEAGVDPGFEEIDDVRDEIIRQITWETFVMDADEDDKKILRLMNDFNVRDASAKALLKAVCDNQDIDFDVPNDDKSSLQDLFDTVREVLKDLYSLIRESYDDIPDAVERGAARADNLQQNMIKFRRKTRGKKSADLTNRELIDILMVFSAKSSVSVVQKCWGDSTSEKKSAKDIGIKFQDFREERLAPVIERISASVYNYLLVPFALKAKDVYMQYKRTVAELNFQDLLMKTSQLLRDYPEVRTYFQSKYKTLLIDEFQDTDPIQAEIAMFLTGNEVEEKLWQKITPREGSLFVVGDPKQSIYGFRRADFRLYNRFKKHVKDTGGKIVELKTNFRATNDLGYWNNAVFPKLLTGEDQAVFTEMDTVLPASEDTISGVAFYRIDAKTNAEILAVESMNLVRIISYLVQNEKITERVKGEGDNYLLLKRQVQYKDIMVLARKKKQLELIANAVAASGVPVRITGADITKRTSEFIYFAELIRMLAYPEDNAYIYNVMRGDFFGFTMRELFIFKKYGGDFRIYFDFDEFYKRNTRHCTQNPDRIVSDGTVQILTAMNLDPEVMAIFEKVRECFTKLRQFSDYIQNLAPAAATERIIEELGIMRIHLTSNEKLSGFGSFVSLIEKIRLKKISDIWGLNLFLDELSAMIESGFEEDIDIEGKDVDAVRFMNVHKAKGLEAPIVILAAPCSGTLPDPSFYTEQIVAEDGAVNNYGYIRIKKNPEVVFSKAFYEPINWNEVEDKARRSEELESDRLLYVAATRAKNLLIISDSAAKDAQWEKLMSLLPSGTMNILEKAYRAESCVIRDEHEITDSEIAAFDDELERMRSDRNAVFTANRPTYKMLAPSHETKRVRTDEEPGDDDFEKSIVENTIEVTINGDETSIRADKLSIGRIVHSVLDVLISDESMLLETMDLILKDNTEEHITKEFLQSIADGFKRHPLWAQLKSSDAVYTEVPFSYKAPVDSKFSGETPEEDMYINGYIDLVFKGDDGWVIIDFKTHDSKEVAHDIRSSYDNQLDIYKEVWEKITGEPVVKTDVFFILKRVQSS
ncbi:MAG: UvrD-helicase domain-containing protein [Oscillospiraceae bacterium]|nr:UvrD-helicase domain-containing protein [Oscillospiraceae bacterium]